VAARYSPRRTLLRIPPRSRALRICSSASLIAPFKPSHSKPRVEIFFDWIEREFEQHGLKPPTAFTKALEYARSRRAGLVIFRHKGAIRLSAYRSHPVFAVMAPQDFRHKGASPAQGRASRVNAHRYSPASGHPARRVVQWLAGDSRCSSIDRACCACGRETQIVRSPAAA
jgi:hypothetical protein